MACLIAFLCSFDDNTYGIEFLVRVTAWARFLCSCVARQLRAAAAFSPRHTARLARCAIVVVSLPCPRARHARSGRVSLTPVTDALASLTHSQLVRAQKFSIRDTAKRETIFVVERPPGELPQLPPGFDKNRLRTIQYEFPRSLLDCKEIGTTYARRHAARPTYSRPATQPPVVLSRVPRAWRDRVLWAMLLCCPSLFALDARALLTSRLVFRVGAEPVRNFRIIERHYFRQQLLHNVDQLMNYCIPNSTNEFEIIYTVPAITAETRACPRPARARTRRKAPPTHRSLVVFARPPSSVHLLHRSVAFRH
jgi:hypothetical protein